MVELSEKLKKYADGGHPDLPLLFRLENTGKRDPNSDNAESYRGANYAPTTTIIDRWEPDPARRMKVISHVIGQRPVNRNGKIELEDETEMVSFTKMGNCMVQPHEYTKKLYLRLSDHCGTNPFRDRTKPVLWNEVKAESQQLFEKMQTADLQLEAELHAKDMSAELLRAYAPELDIRIAGRQIADIRYDMRQYAREYPRKFLEGSPSAETRAKLLIDDARSLQLLDYHPDDRAWLLQKEPLFAHQVTENKDKALIEFLAGKHPKFQKGEGQQAFASLQTALNVEDGY